jgi:hypothetical protein
VLPSRTPGSPSWTNDQWSLDLWPVSVDDRHAGAAGRPLQLGAQRVAGLDAPQGDRGADADPVERDHPAQGAALGGRERVDVRRRAVVVVAITGSARLLGPERDQHHR